MQDQASELRTDVNDGPPPPKICKLLLGESYHNQCFDENGQLLEDLGSDDNQHLSTIYPCTPLQCQQEKN